MMNLLKPLVISAVMFGASISLLGCKSTQVISAKNVSVDPQVYQDQHFLSDNTFEYPTEEEIFALDDEIRSELMEINYKYPSPVYKARAVVELIFYRSDSSMLYNNSANFTARETYHNGQANCLSLAILAYAMVKELDMVVDFQQIAIPEYWTQQEGYSLLNNHVNIKIAATQSQKYVMWNDVVIDFDPFSPKKKFPSSVIDKTYVLAMFYNNKGAEAFINNDHYTAYQYFKLATQTAPHFVGAWNNLGFLYRVANVYDASELSYQIALSIQPNNLNTMNNLAVLYEHNGNEDTAKQLREEIHRQRQFNPYFHGLKGDEAFRAEQWDEAILHYSKALSLKENEHEFYFGLAKSYYQLGNYAKSKFMLSQAVKFADIRQLRNAYERKMHIFKADTVAQQ